MNSSLFDTKLKLLQLIAFLGIGFNGYSQIQMGVDIDGEAVEDKSGISVSMPDEYTIAVGARNNDGGASFNCGHVRVYSWNGTSWMQKGADIDGDLANDWAAWVSMPDSNTLAIGAPANDGTASEAGQVKVYEWIGTAWIQKGLDINGEAFNDYSGTRVCMPNSNIVAIGAPNNDGSAIDAGHVRVYEWNGTAWVQKGVDLDGEASGDHSGCAVSMPDANTLAVGARNNGGNGASSGHVRIYSWDGTIWVQKGMDIDGEGAYDQSGEAISMADSNTIAIGAIYNTGVGTNAGHVRVYAWDGAAWTQKGLDIDAEAASNWAGASVSMPDANTVAIGAPQNSGNGLNAGQVRIYKWNGVSWIQSGMDIDGEVAGDFSGESVSMPDAKTIVIGASSNDGNGSNSGHVRVYKLPSVQGLIYNDMNQNCVLDELGVVTGVLGVIQPGNFVVETSDDGIWSLDSLAIGNYTIAYDTTGNWVANCPNLVGFTISDPNIITQVPSFGMTTTNPCPEPNVSIHMPFMRPGFSEQYVYVSACNAKSGSGTLYDTNVEVTLDDSLTVNASSMSFIDLGNNTFSFNIGNLNPGECVNFNLATTLSSNAVLGRTLCMEAKIFPLDSCVLDTLVSPTPPDFTPCSLPWDKSSLILEGKCINDTIVFTILNNGAPVSGDMDCYSPVRLYIDGVYIWLDSLQLAGGDSYIYSFPGDGQTWHLEVDQHPLHPGNSHPSATVERCGNATNWTPDLVNIFPHDDFDPINDIFCDLVKGSYDPNDKTGFPLGTGPDHLIIPNGKIDYVIRFQNTGTDTAFTVVIRDTLESDLDLFSVLSGVSSHPYSFRIYGPRVLEWTFDNILLPDSTTNQSGSNGFVTFTVNQVASLPDGTEINNTADIYFDFNAPVITNTTSHVIARDIQMASWSEEFSISDSTCDAYIYNGVVYSQSGTYYQVKDGASFDTLVTLNLSIGVSDVSTSLSGITITANNSNATYVWLGCDNNFAVISGELGQSYSPLRSGSYAVQLFENGCLDTSDCVAITTNTIIDNFVLYPNPSNGEIRIVFENSQQEVIISLYSITGQLLENKSYMNTSVIQFEIEEAPGAYLLKINLNEEEAIIRVVKQ